MATATFVQEGNSVDYTPEANVTAGDVVVQGDLVGIAKLDIPANTQGALAVTGVFEMPKVAGAAEIISAGATVYWDKTNSRVVTSDAGGVNKKLGKAVALANSLDPTVLVRVSQ